MRRLASVTVDAALAELHDVIQALSRGIMTSVEGMVTAHMMSAYAANAADSGKGLLARMIRRLQHRLQEPSIFTDIQQLVLGRVGQIVQRVQQQTQVCVCVSVCVCVCV